jgi:hypothetical protein
MRKFKRCPVRALLFRLFVIVAGALLLMAAFAPRANAALIVYFNFEDAIDEGPPDFTSDITPANPGGGVVLTTMTTNYTSGEAFADNPGFSLNRSAGDIDVFPATGNFDVALTNAGGNNNRHFDFNVFSPNGFYQTMTLSFAVGSISDGGGFTSVTLQYSTNGGGTFTTFATVAIVGTTTSPQLVSQAVPALANNKNLLTFRIFFTGGTGTDGSTEYTEFDNFQLTGTIVPEPATVAGGLLGVLGLCFHQRRRLIRFAPRLRRA